MTITIRLTADQDGTFDVDVWDEMADERDEDLTRSCIPSKAGALAYMETLKANPDLSVTVLP
jgi:hypothetical protein